MAPLLSMLSFLFGLLYPSASSVWDTILEILVNMVDAYHESPSVDLKSQNLPKSCNVEDNNACRNNKDHKSCGYDVAYLAKGACPDDVDEVTSEFDGVIFGQPFQKVSSMSSQDTEATQVEEATKPIVHTYIYDFENKSVQMNDDTASSLVYFKDKTIQVEDEDIQSVAEVCLSDMKGTGKPSMEEDDMKGKAIKVEVGASKLMQSKAVKVDVGASKLIQSKAVKVDVGASKLMQSKAIGYMYIVVLTFALLFQVVAGDSNDDFMGPMDQIVQQGERAVLTCHTSGLTPLKWIKDATEIYSGYGFRHELQHQYSIIKDKEGQHDLVINNSNEDAVGNYTCLRPGDLMNKTARLLLVAATIPASTNPVVIGVIVAVPLATILITILVVVYMCLR